MQKCHAVTIPIIMQSITFFIAIEGRDDVFSGIINNDMKSCNSGIIILTTNSEQIYMQARSFIIVTVYMKRDHFTRLINLQNGSSNPEKKKKFFFEFFFSYLYSISGLSTSSTPNFTGS